MKNNFGLSYFSRRQHETADLSPNQGDVPYLRRASILSTSNLAFAWLALYLLMSPNIFVGAAFRCREINESVNFHWGIQDLVIIPFQFCLPLSNSATTASGKNALYDDVFEKGHSGPDLFGYAVPIIAAKRALFDDGGLFLAWRSRADRSPAPIFAGRCWYDTGA